MQDFSEINDFLSKEEIKKYIDDFLVSHQSLNDESIIDAFDQLCELADRQCNTYTILEKECRKVAWKVGKRKKNPGGKYCGRYLCLRCI